MWAGPHKCRPSPDVILYLHSIPCGTAYIVTLVRLLLDRPTFHIAFTHSCLGRSTYLPITRMPVVALPIGVFLVKMYWNATLPIMFSVARGNPATTTC